MQENELSSGITIFTPTYNRAHTLSRLYDSLVTQNSSWFEWVIVDDGSTDNTRDLINQFLSENKIEIRYVHKENGGKHTALNMGIQLASREYFCCVDSDDYLAEEAIKIIQHVVETKQPQGIIAYKAEWPVGERIGDEFPEDLLESSLFDLVNVYSCRGDRTLIFQTSLIKGSKIPEPDGVSFFPETYLYDRFDEKYKCVLVREKLCVCEYLEGGYSDSFRMLMIRNALSMKWFYAERIDMNCSDKMRFNFAVHYIGFALLARSKAGAYTGEKKGILIASAPFGFLMYVMYLFCRMKERRGK